MSVVRVSYILECPGHGARETWFFGISPGQTLGDALEIWRPTAEKRRLLLGATAKLKAIEASIEFNDAGEPVLGDSAISYAYLSGFQSQALADPNLALLLKAQTAGRMRRRNQYLRMIWDSVELEGGQYTVPQGSTWQTKIESWKASMLAIPGGVGYMQSTRSAQVNLTSYVQNVDGTVNLTFGGNLFPLTDVGKKRRVRIYTARAKSQLAGMLVVQVLSQTTAVTVNRIAVLDQPVTGWTGSVYTYAFTPTPIIDDQKIVEHLIGRPLLESRGRRPVRARI